MILKIHIFKTYVLTPYDPNEQWVLSVYSNLLEYDMNGKLKSALIRKNVIDEYNLDKNYPTFDELF